MNFAKFLNCNVITYLVSNKDREQKTNAIENLISGVTGKAKEAGHEL